MEKGRSSGGSLVGGAACANAARTFEACERALAQDVLIRVMSGVGEGHDAFIATVCKEWKEHYRRGHSAKTTSKRSVIESAERVHWAKRLGCELSVGTFQAAARHGDVEVCKALYAEGCPWNEDVCRATVKNWQHGLSVLKWLRSRNLFGKERCPWDDKICGEAAYRGNVEILKWILSDAERGPFESSTWEFACLGGNIPVVDYLLSNPRTRALVERNRDGKWRRGAMYAAINGHLGVLQLLHANAYDLCAWDARVCRSAVMSAQSLPMLKWLRSEEVQCAWDEESCPQVMHDRGILFQIDAESLEMKQWVHANGHPCSCED